MRCRDGDDCNSVAHFVTVTVAPAAFTSHCNSFCVTADFPLTFLTIDPKKHVVKLFVVMITCGFMYFPAVYYQTSCSDRDI